jgi:hypothetical protein
MPALTTSAAGLGVSVLGARLLRRRRRSLPEGLAAPGAVVRLPHPLFVSGTSAAGDFRGRAVAVAVDGPAEADRTR